MKNARFLLISVFFSAGALQASESNLTKQKILARYDAIVEQEKNNFLETFGISAEEVNDPFMVTELKKSHDDDTLVALQEYETEHGVEVAIQVQKLQKLASPFFAKKNMNCNIIHTYDCDDENRSHAVIYGSEKATAYIFLNALTGFTNKQAFLDFLNHDRFQIQKNDLLTSNILRYYAWNEGGDEKDIEDELLSVLNAMTQRADVYTVLTSPNNGYYLLEYLKKLEQNSHFEQQKTHHDRIELLQDVQTELKN